MVGMADSWFENGAAAGGEGSSFFANDAVLPPPVPRGDPAYELRPLTTGEVLDRTFFLYRNHFWLFVGISAVAATVSVVTSIVEQLYLHFSRHGVPVPKNDPAAAFANLGVIFGAAVVGGLLYLVVYSVTQAATVSAVTAIYLGEATSLQDAFKAVTGRWARYLLIALWQAWSGMWFYLVVAVPGFAVAIFLSRKGGGAAASGMMALAGLLIIVGGFGGLIYGVIAYLRNSLAVPAEVMEGLTVRKAMRRSKTLAAGTKWRIFLLFLLLAAIYLVAGGVMIPLALVGAKMKGGEAFFLQAIVLFVSFVIRSVVGPIGAIGLCLFYIDQRVRKEGFDIEFLIERAGPVVVPAVVETVYPAELS